ncbi:MAG: hypothetical protein IJ587_02900 [Synergistaceae bacterium]|nr:hypothetical protein [Synergistaceae bacterium]
MAMVVNEISNNTIMQSGNVVILSKDEYEELLVAKKNDEYRRKLEHSIEQLRTGKTVEKSIEELEALENE